MSEKVERAKVRVKKSQSILGKIKLFFEEIPDSKKSSYAGVKFNKRNLTRKRK